MEIVLLIDGPTSMHHHYHITLSPGLGKRSPGLGKRSPAARRGEKLQSQPHPLYLSEKRRSQHLETQDKLNQSVTFSSFSKKPGYYFSDTDDDKRPVKTQKYSNQAVDPSFHQTILKRNKLKSSVQIENLLCGRTPLKT